MAYFICEKQARCCPHEFYDSIEQAITDSEDGVLCDHLIEVESVRHGRWILEREPDGKPYCFHCSVCDDDFHYIGITAVYNYCPNCGAKMDLNDLED